MLHRYASCWDGSLFPAAHAHPSPCLQWAGGADRPAGWYQACAAAAAQCLAGSFVFLAAARGERLFGGDAAAAEQAAALGR